MAELRLQPQLKQTLELLLSPRLLQMLKVLNLPYMELVDKITSEAEENVMLEVERRDEYIEFINYITSDKKIKKEGDFSDLPGLENIGNVSKTLDEQLIEQLELATGQSIRAGETLLFLDEIQACPRAITALRYFYEEMPELHVIAAGSLLEFAMSEASVPVGRVSYLEMYPMTFREYLSAIGNEPAAEAVARGPAAFASPIHDMLLNALKRFLFVGGLPDNCG